MGVDQLHLGMRFESTAAANLSSDNESRSFLWDCYAESHQMYHLVDMLEQANRSVEISRKFRFS